MIIGIVGKSGSGKSYLSSLITTYGKSFTYINIDEVGHAVLDIPEVQEKIYEYFQVKVSSNNRKALSDVVFKNKKAMDILTEITESKMLEIIDKTIEENTNCILDWILLPKTKYWQMCDIKILIKPVKEDDRIKNVLKRDNITLEKFETRDSASIEYDEDEFNYIILNNYK